MNVVALVPVGVEPHADMSSNPAMSVTQRLIMLPPDSHGLVTEGIRNASHRGISAALAGTLWR